MSDLKLKETLKNLLQLLTAPPIKTATYTKTVSISGTGWSGAQTIPFSVPTGYTALSGAVTQNSGYVTIYNNHWTVGATSAGFSAYNRYSSSVSVVFSARVIFVRTELL